MNIKSIDKLHKAENGFALAISLMMIAVFSSIFATYMVMTRTEKQSVGSSKHSFSGFNAAEAGLNMRAEIIKNEFLNFNRPSGTSPANVEACADPTTDGTGDYECTTYTLQGGQTATTYVTEDPTNPTTGQLIPLGEPFAGLTADEYRYTVSSVAVGTKGDTEAQLDLVFKARLVPLFQFGIFFNDDLDIMGGGVINFTGPIHTNGDMYLSHQTTGSYGTNRGSYSGPLSSAGVLYRGVKYQSTCNGYSHNVRVDDLSNFVSLPTCGSSTSTFELSDTQLAPYNGNMVKNVDPVTVPPIASFDAFAVSASGAATFTYWERARLRFVLRLRKTGPAWLRGSPDTTNAATGIEVVNVDGSLNANATAALNDPAVCPGSMVTAGGGGLSVGAKGDWGAIPAYSADDQLRLYRDWNEDPVVNNFVSLLDVDMRSLFDCIHDNQASFMGAIPINSTIDGGMVFFFAVDGPDSTATRNNYGVRYSNGAVLQTTDAADPNPVGLTVVTDQRTIVWGDYNAINATWIPASFLTDTLYFLSDNWVDADSHQTNRWNRRTGPTALNIQAAVLTATQISCGANGIQCTGGLNNDFGGGFIGVFRFNETFYDGPPSWNQQPLFWAGSIVELNQPKHNDSSFGPFNYYSAPARNLNYDVRFNDPANLPPLTPRMVYNKQELFVRDYE